MDEEGGRGRLSRPRCSSFPSPSSGRACAAGFKLALHDDEVRINPTLLEMLREDFKLRMPELEGDLPPGWLRVRRRRHLPDRPPAREGTARLGGGAGRRALGLLLHQVPDVEGLGGPGGGAEAQPRRAPSHRHAQALLRRRHAVSRAARLDREHPPETVFAPLSADSSQLSAVLAAAGGKDFVLFGPPGTGKSQTIGNMIAQCLAQGRTVLFVSQKTAALEVVQRRLQEIGLGDYCLEVHSTKAQKSAVLGQLRRAWHERSTPSQGTWDAATSELASLREELNGLVNALHRRRENGLPPMRPSGVSSRPAAASLRSSSHGRITSPTTRRRSPTCARPAGASPVLASVGSLVDHPLQGVEATQWSPVWRDDMGAAIRAVEQTLGALRVSGQAFAEAIGLPSLLATYAGTRGLVVLGNYLVRSEARCGAAFLADGAGDLRRAVAARERFQTTKAQLLGRLTGRTDRHPRSESGRTAGRMGRRAGVELPDEGRQAKNAWRHRSNPTQRGRCHPISGRISRG